MRDEWQLGGATITRVDELRWTETDPTRLYPELDAAGWGAARAEVPADALDPADGGLRLGTHAWLVRRSGQVILVDAATGNGKHLPEAPVLDGLDTNFVDRLRAAGVAPEAVDLVVLTHLHADHVGWCTCRDGARWMPTFPNARHVCSRVELDDALALARDPADDSVAPAALGRRVRRPYASVFNESVRPVLDAGLVDPMAVDGREIADGIALLPTPGHSVDHASILLRTDEGDALFLGDTIHTPLQVVRTELDSVYCEFPDMARRSRQAVLDRAARDALLCFTSHTGGRGVGRVERVADDFRWSVA